MVVKPILLVAGSVTRVAVSNHDSSEMSCASGKRDVTVPVTIPHSVVVVGAVKCKFQSRLENSTLNNFKRA